MSKSSGGGSRKNPRLTLYNKYKAVRVTRGGRSFASKLESALHRQLELLEQAGALRDLKCQPHVFLTEARIEMIPDFSAIDTRTGELVYFEAKGFETDVWRIKRKLWKYYGPGKLEVYKGSASRLVLHETIIP